MPASARRRPPAAVLGTVAPAVTGTRGALRPLPPDAVLTSACGRTPPARPALVAVVSALAPDTRRRPASDRRPPTAGRAELSAPTAVVLGSAALTVVPGPYRSTVPDPDAQAKQADAEADGPDAVDGTDRSSTR
ncbi:hypothetical protein [Streptomyces sp. NPDC088726]|uniref:hypothetical protein n=1 Tax=Streptomyces sp. NPDC088726 TaxID=3365874 RepID=UPI0037F9298B